MSLRADGLNSRISAILAGIAAADTAAVAELGEFSLRQMGGGRVIGDFYKCRLSSVFQPVYGADGSSVIGHEARVRSTGGDDALSPWGIFSTIADDRALVRLDRLCRSLHMLNYFTRAHEGRVLFLRVEPRLLASVKHDHGRVFGEVLDHCGIATSQVVIEIPQGLAVDGELLARVIPNYRSRGYRVAVDYPSRESISGLDDLQPDFLRIDARQVSAVRTLKPLVDRVHNWGGRAVVTHIEVAPNLVAPLGSDVDALQGYFLGRPQFDCIEQCGLPALPQSIVAAAAHGSGVAALAVSG